MKLIILQIILRQKQRVSDCSNPLLVNLSKEKFCFVPQIDWKQPINDSEIYKRYGLTDKEANFIEAMIHPFDRGELNA